MHISCAWNVKTKCHIIQKHQIIKVCEQNVYTCVQMFTGSTSGCKRWQVVSPCKVFTVASERPTIHLSSGFNYGQFSDISTDKLRFAELWPRGFVTGSKPYLCNHHRWFVRHSLQMANWLSKILSLIIQDNERFSHCLNGNAFTFPNYSFSFLW